MPLYPPAPRAPYAYNAETHTATCRTCWISEGNLLPEEAGPWHASHQGQCTGTPAARPSATVLPFRRPAATAQDPAQQDNATDGASPVDAARPACPECGAAMGPMQFEGFDFFNCPACGRRSFSSDDYDDSELPSYTQEEDGTVFIYHGTGEVDVEATAELAAQAATDEGEQR